jgi:capsule polysaccharide export protein KpsE/RkpR
MKFTGTSPVHQPDNPPDEGEIVRSPSELVNPESQHKTVASLRLLWERRQWLFRIAIYAFIASAVFALLIPSRYESTARLMPPDNQSGSGLAMAAAAAMSGATGSSGGGGGLSGIAGDLLGLKSTSDAFVGILGSRTAQDALIQKFDLKKRYRDRRMEDARKALASRTSISVDRKSQIISITVTDWSPQIAAAMGQAYVDELNRLVAELSTSSARRERIFLEGRLQGVNHDLEVAEKNFSQFASKNTALDIKEQGKAMVEGAAMLQGQMIAAESQLQGLRQIYSDNNVRVRSIQARIDELKKQLEKLGGKGESVTEVSSQPGDSMYPSIRKLPLLGVEYADLYRDAKIQEVVLESLTKEYEMAKVEEAKEIPTVKVLDVPNVPDKKSFPPRSLIVLLGTGLALCAGALYLFGSASWEAVDAQDPGKQFASEVWVELRAYRPWISKNGSGAAVQEERILESTSDLREQDDKHT